MGNSVVPSAPIVTSLGSKVREAHDVQILHSQMNIVCLHVPADVRGVWHQVSTRCLTLGCLDSAVVTAYVTRNWPFYLRRWILSELAAALTMVPLSIVCISANVEGIPLLFQT